MKIILEPNESSAIANFAASGHQAYPVLKKIFKYYQDELESVRNIDPKGNMGLQSLARQEALKILDDISNEIFPDISPPRRKEEPGKKISQYR